MSTYLCIEETFFGGRLWAPGEIFRGEMPLNRNPDDPNFKKPIKHKCFSLQKEIDPTSEDGGHLVHQERLDRIKRLLIDMDKEDDLQWTNSGLPNVNWIVQQLGFKTQRLEVDEAYPGFNRNIKALSQVNPQRDIPVIK